MKILQIRFKNINSLQGEWLIDFTDPQYLANGIFALTGPTGAGKSTILDALCLALYGSTPRLGKITKNNNDIMSRQTGECYAEVSFESSEGRFRCHWSQHRARKKPEGKLAESRHEISDADSGDILESKKRHVAEVIEAKTGMDFERFTRSILLAQGGFDTFLKADIEQKSKILEQITGTEIYSKISQRTHEQLKTEREQLNLLRAEISSINLLSEAEEKTIAQTLEKQQQQKVKLLEQLNQTQTSLNWLTGIKTLNTEIEQLEKQSEQLKIALQEFVPQRNKLKLAIKASHLDGIYATLKALRKQRQSDDEQLKTEQQKLPELEATIEQQQSLLQQSEQHLSEAKNNLQGINDVLKKVRSVDQHIADKNLLVKKLQTEYQQELEQIKQEQQFILKLQKESERIKEQRHISNTYLQNNSQDQWLISGLAGIKEQLLNLTAIQKDIIKNKQHYQLNLQEQNQQQQKLFKKNEEVNTCQQTLTEIQTQIKQKQQRLKKLLNERLLREYRAEKDSLLRELNLLRTIADLESERKKLTDNKPCPLCGSLEHPYAMGNVPAMDKTEKKLLALEKIITQAEQIEVENNSLNRAEKAAQETLSETEKQLLTENHTKQNIVQTLTKLEQDLTRAEQDFSALKSSVLNHLQPLGISELGNMDFEQLLNSLQERLQNWTRQQQKLNEFDLTLSQYNADIKTHDTMIKTYKKSSIIKQQQLQKDTLILEQFRAERQALFGSKDPDAEENQLRQNLIAAEQAESNLRTEFIRIQQHLNSVQVNIQSLQQRIKKAIVDLEKREQEFKHLLLQQGFTLEAEFIQAGLSLQERDQLNNQAVELDNRQLAIQTRLTDSRQKLKLEQSRAITQKSLDALFEEQQQQEHELSKLRDEVAALKHQLEQNRIDRDKIKQQQSAIDSRQQECQRWEKLHALIGSADGKKFRNFAQGLTFELMVAHANRQLKKMSDRYLLIRDKLQPLELNVVDNYQGGEIRSVRNLSGGESFIVSLTLALGLSKMASQKVRVDSLFLDEGFGSLDEDALESALEALSSLHQNGKLIGIISHVSALKERISTRIQVKPLLGGKSIITGPGCSKINHVS